MIFAAVCLTLAMVAHYDVFGANEDPSSPAKPAGAGVALLPNLAPFSIIAGCWRAELPGDQVLDECWERGAGDSIFGSFRWMKSGKVWMFEMLSLIDESDGVIMRIKHFNDDMVGWEEKNESVELKLVRDDGGKFEFERIRSDQNTRVVYEKTGVDSLIVRLTKTKDGKLDSNEFRFRRLKDSGP